MNKWAWISILMAFPAVAFAQGGRGASGAGPRPSSRGIPSSQARPPAARAFHAATAAGHQPSWGLRPALPMRSSFTIRASPVAATRIDPTPVPTPPPAYDYTPGALIRTTGLPYTMRPTNDAHYQITDAGDKVVLDPNQSVAVDAGPGPHYEALNAASSGGASGRNAVTANAPAVGAGAKK